MNYQICLCSLPVCVLFIFFPHSLSVPVICVSFFMFSTLHNSYALISILLYCLLQLNDIDDVPFFYDLCSCPVSYLAICCNENKKCCYAINIFGCTYILTLTLLLLHIDILALLCKSLDFFYCCCSFDLY